MRHALPQRPRRGEPSWTAGPSCGTAEPASRPLLEPSLAELRARIDAALASPPGDRAELRARVAGQLGIDPRPEEVEAIARIAAGAGGDRMRELVGTALALRVLAERGTRGLFEPTEFSPEGIGRSARLVSGLLGTVDAFQAEVRDRLDGLAPRERDDLLEVADALLPEVEPLIAGTVLASRLVALAEATESGEPRAVVPALTDSDVAALSAAAHDAEGEGDDLRWLGVNAIALRTVIEDDLAAWQQVQDAAGEDHAAAREQVLERMKRDRATYRFVAHVLQRRLDEALLAGSADSTLRLRRLQRELFSIYLRLTAALTVAAQPASGTPLAAPEAAADLDRLLRACHSSETGGGVRHGRRVPTERLYADALEDVQGAAAKPVVVVLDPQRLARERLRLRWLLATAGVLLAACLIVYGGKLRRGTVELNVAPSELPGAIELIHAMRVGPMVYAQTTHWAWQSLGAGERRRGVEQLGLAVLERGFSTLYLSDEAGAQLASWTRLEGARLAAAPAAPPP